MADTAPDAMRDHLWWRPGWRPGRPYLTWHLLPPPALVAEVRQARDALYTVEHLAPVEDRWLHVTGPGLGFADEIPRDVVGEVVRGARERLASVRPVTARLENVRVWADGVGCPLTAPGLHELRAHVRSATRDAGLIPPGADDEPFAPHLTLAYATGPADPEAARHALDGVGGGAGGDPERTVTLDELSLLALRMDPPRYVWEVVARVRLGQ